VLVISLFYGVLGFECVLLVCFLGFQIFSVFFVGGFSKCLSAFVVLVSIRPLVCGFFFGFALALPFSGVWR